MTANTCPVCGSGISSSSITKLVTIDYYQSFSVGYPIVECNTCGYSGSEEDTSDNAIESARKDSNSSTLKKLINDATSGGKRSSFVERAFNLPPRTLNRWKNQSGSAAALALMKLINTYNWLPKVAENGYEPEYAKNEQYRQVSTQFTNDRRSSGFSHMIAHLPVFDDEGKVFFAMASMGNDEPEEVEGGHFGNNYITAST